MPSNQNAGALSSDDTSKDTPSDRLYTAAETPSQAAFTSMTQVLAQMRANGNLLCPPEFAAYEKAYAAKR